MITLTSDLRVAFDQIGVKFMSICNENREELEAIARKAVESFDFETVITAGIHQKIRQGLEDAFSEIDLNDSMSVLIWNEINKKLGGIVED